MSSAATVLCERTAPLKLDADAIEAEREFHAGMVDSVDASIAARLGVPAPWPSRLLRLRMERMTPLQRLAFVRAVERMAAEIVNTTR